MWYADVELYVVNLAILVLRGSLAAVASEASRLSQAVGLVAVCLGAGLYLCIEATARGYIAVPIAGSHSGISLQDKP